MTGTRRRSIFTARLVNSAEQGQQPRVTDDLRRAILSGDEPPGTLIPIDAVAGFFGVSPIPVREALKVLLGEGLVEHVPRVGYSVAKLTFVEFRELYDVRQALEASALRESVARATPEHDAAVRATHLAMADAMGGGDERDYHAQSRLFHAALIAPSGMQRLVHMYESAWNMTEPARPMSRIDVAGRAVFYADHDRMLAAFVARDAAALVEESRLHIRPPAQRDRGDRRRPRRVPQPRRWLRCERREPRSEPAAASRISLPQPDFHAAAPRARHAVPRFGCTRRPATTPRSWRTHDPDRPP